MKHLRLITWLDVRRTVCRKTNYGSNLPDGVVRIGCFSDALEIGIVSDASRESAENIIKERFGDWYQEDQRAIRLDLNDAILPVEFIPGEERSLIEITVRPFWEKIAYLKNESEEETLTAKPVNFPQHILKNLV